jgi:hypothetical protein
VFSLPEPEAAIVRPMSMRRGAAVAAVSLVIAACSSPSATVCTLVGAEPEVLVVGGAPGAVVQVCDGAVCGSVSTGPGTRDLRLPSLRPGKQATLRVTYTAATKVVTSILTVVPGKLQPNGASCPPAVGVVSIAIETDGRAVLRS